MVASGGGKKSNIGAIVGGVVGGVVFLAIVGGLIFWLRRRKRSCVSPVCVADSREDVSAYRTVNAFTGGSSAEARGSTTEVDTTPVSMSGSYQ